MSALAQPRPLVLASSSPRRAELLRGAGYDFVIAEPPVQEPEQRHPHVSPSNYAESVAYYKARSVVPRHPRDTILAADTLAVLEHEVIGKPRDLDDARRILRRLSGTTHAVITGVVLLRAAKGQRELRHAVSTVRVRKLTDDMIESYLGSGQWQGKAGAYGVQDAQDPFVESVDGSFTNVVGLPMELVTRLLAEGT